MTGPPHPGVEAQPTVVAATAVEAAVATAHRESWARVLAATVRVCRDVGVAEECVQEAYASALTTWGRSGVPTTPAAWLTTTARRRATDVVRREQTLRSKLPLLVEPDESADPGTDGEQELIMPDDHEVRDDRLRLIFLCCHPALAADAQQALTLRLVCGVATEDIASAFVVSESTMAARLTRAKKKISVSRIPFRMPAEDELPTRLDGVLGTIHLLFTTGHTAPSGVDLVRVDLVEQAVHLARVLAGLLPENAEVAGLLALLLATDARRATRVDDQGRLLQLRDQDRSRWDRAAIAEADRLIITGLRRGRPGRHLLQAAIATLYAEAVSYDQTDWGQILTLYDTLLVVWPSPVVALNRTVALAEVAGAAVALAEVERLEPDGSLSAYHYLPAIKADLLRRLGRRAEAADSYRRALGLVGNDAEREFLTRELHRSLAGPSKEPPTRTVGP